MGWIMENQSLRYKSPGLNIDRKETFDDVKTLLFLPLEYDSWL